MISLGYCCDLHILVDLALHVLLALGTRVILIRLLELTALIDNVSLVSQGMNTHENDRLQQLLNPQKS